MTASKRWQIATGVLAVALVTALVVLVLTMRSLSHERDLTDTRSQAQAAARKAVVSMTTYDYRTLARDFSWVDQAGTAKFRKQYAEISAPIEKLVLQLKARAVGSIVASAANVTDLDHVTVLLFVDQVLSNPGQTQPGLDQPRVSMTMVRQGGRWLVDEVEVNNLTTQ